MTAALALDQTRPGPNPVSPSRVMRSTVGLTNRLIATRPPVALSAAGQEVALTVSAAMPAARETVWLGLEFGGEPGALGLPSVALTALAGGVEIGGGATDPAIVALLAEAAFAPWLDAFERRGAGAALGGVRLTGGVQVPGDDWIALQANASITGALAEPMVATVALSLTREAAGRLLAALDALAPPMRVPGFPVACDVRAASRVVPLSALKDLAPGDAIVLNRRPQDVTAFLIVAQRAAAKARLVGRELTVLGPLTPLPSNSKEEAHPMLRDRAALNADAAAKPASDPTPAAEAASVVDTAREPGTSTGHQKGLDIGDLPVRLDFDFGSLDLSLSDLDGLAPGQVFDLAADPEHAVTIRAAGRRIGRGELVDLGGTLGVRITALNTQ